MKPGNGEKEDSHADRGNLDSNNSDQLLLLTPARRCRSSFYNTSSPQVVLGF